MLLTGASGSLGDALLPRRAFEDRRDEGLQFAYLSIGYCYQVFRTSIEAGRTAYADVLSQVDLTNAAGEVLHGPRGGVRRGMSFIGLRWIHGDES